MLQKRNEPDPYVKQMVTGDENGTTYDNIKKTWLW